MNPNDFINMIGGNFGNAKQESPIIRNPTPQELDTFIEPCCEEKDYNNYILGQEIAFKLERGVHSPVEAVVLPMVLGRLQRLQQTEDNNKC